MSKAGRGAMDFKSDAERRIVVVKWLHHNAVHIAGKYVGVEPLGASERCSPEEKHTQFPQVIMSYNQGLDGIDLSDMLISLYQINIGTRRRFLKIFGHRTSSWLT